MSWELSIWPANKAGAPRIITQADTVRGIDDGFDWQLTPFGGTVQLKMNVVNGLTQLPPLGIVALKVNGQAAFYGRVPDPSHAQSQDIEEQLVQGGRTILDGTLMDGKAYQGDQGVYTIVRDVLARLCPPTLTYLPTLIGNGTGTDTGPTLSTVYKPTATLSEVLTDLAKTAGVGWDVDVQGRIFFGQAAPAGLTVAYAGQPWSRLRVQGRETVTQAVLRVATSQAVDGVTDPYASYSPAGVPKTITAVATASAHALYGAQKAFEPPDGIGLLLAQLPAAGTPAGGSYVNPAGAMDTDPGTYSEITLGTTQLSLEVISAVGRPVGVEVLYSLPEMTNMPDTFRLLVQTGTGATLLASLPTTTDIRTARVILPPDAATGDTWLSKVSVGADAAFSAGTPGALRVYMVRFLFVDEARASDVAASFLQVPFATPAELTLSGLVTPRPTLTVTGSPDGDVMGSTALWEYSYRAGTGERTLVRLGSDGQSDAARAIKFAVKK